MGIFDTKNSAEKINTGISILVKIALILAVFYAVYYSLWHILFADLILLFLLFLPYFLKKKYRVIIPIEFEIIFLIFILITFLIGEIRGIIIQTFFGIAVGFIGFTIMLLLFSHSNMKTNYFLIVLFSFSVSVTFGLSAEMLKYYLKIFLRYENITKDYPYTMMNLTLVSFGALFSSLIGYAYMKGYRPEIIKKAVLLFKRKNPNLFIDKIDTPEKLKEIIKKGENNKLEFKSTLRTNLHTAKQDKNIELASLKTIAAFMNSEGGNLLIGISDKGEILGIEKDNFESIDKFNLHLSNLIKEKIGKEYLPYINMQLIPIENKTLMKIECKKSQKPVFLKHEGKEQFFIRAGAATAEVSGSKMIEYISNNFTNS